MLEANGCYWGDFSTARCITAFTNVSFVGHVVSMQARITFTGAIRALAADPFQFAAYPYSHTYTPDGVPLVLPRVATRTPKQSNSTIVYLSEADAHAFVGNAALTDPLPPLLHASVAGTGIYFTPSSICLIIAMILHTLIRSCYEEHLPFAVNSSTHRGSGIEDTGSGSDDVSKQVESVVEPASKSLKAAVM